MGYRRSIPTAFHHVTSPHCFTSDVSVVAAFSASLVAYASIYAAHFSMCVHVLLYVHVTNTQNLNL